MTEEKAKDIAKLVKTIESVEKKINTLCNRYGHVKEDISCRIHVEFPGLLTTSCYLPLEKFEIEILADCYRKELDKLKAELEQM